MWVVAKCTHKVAFCLVIQVFACYCMTSVFKTSHISSGAVSASLGVELSVEESAERVYAAIMASSWCVCV